MSLKRFLVILAFVVSTVGLFGWWVTNHLAAIPDQASPEVEANTTTTPLPSSIDFGLEFSRTDAEPLTFSTGTLNVEITKRTTHTRADAAYLLENAKQCGPDGRPAKYYPELTSTLRQLPKTAYTITDRATSAEYNIGVIPNLLGYSYLDAAQADFFVCPGDANKLKAVQLNKQWIVFVETCPAKEAVCQQIADIVTPTIQLKQNE